MEVKCCGDGKLASRGRMWMDTVCVVMDGNELIFHYCAAQYFAEQPANVGKTGKWTLKCQMLVTFSFFWGV